MKNSNLSVASLMFVLTQRGVSPEEAKIKLKTASDLVSDLISEGFFRGMDEYKTSVTKSLILRSVISTDMSKGEFKENVLSAYSELKLSASETSFFPAELSLTMLSRAVNGYKDFVMSALIYSKITVDEYNMLIKSGDDMFSEFLSKAISLFHSNSSSYSDIYTFCSLLEDIVSTTMFPLLEGFSANPILLESFVDKPLQTLVPMRVTMLDKLKNSIYLADALIKATKKN
ncbi:hypothetical protein [Photobacterium kishitanii]|uniref:Uncharacterized protein n=1 Tax=Photobacterium kishitanii TaxID=318456 RepID=A0A2T3KAW8_9GAMM|nr:hypothetical protein [Photobacterium kishitanii]PSU89772.1 hypothetical protein C9J27_24125 [Photobacterium kishitanii]